MDNKEKALEMHRKWNGKLETVSKTPVKTREDLAIAYTPGVAEPCKVIAERSVCRLYLYHEGKHRCRSIRRKRCSGSRKHRTLRCHACYGRKMRTF